MDDPINLVDDEGGHCRIKKRKAWMECTGRCRCDRDMIIGPRARASASFGSKCAFAEKLDISRCEIECLKRFFRSTEPAMKQYVCEMKRTFVIPGKRMVRSLFVLQHVC